jgi:single-stranded DNA-binding protein
VARPGQAAGRLPRQGRPGHGHRAAAPAQLGDPEGDKRSVTEIEADEVGASLKWATAKVERTSQRGNGELHQGRERQAERGGDFYDAPPTY